MSWLCLLPAFIVILVSVSTKRIALAVLCGIAGGTIVLAEYQAWAWLLSTKEILWESIKDFQRLQIALFVLLIGVLLEMIALSGAYLQFAQKISLYLDSPKKTRIATWICSICLFFDDYANLLITGASMRSIAQRHRISLAMLAYIADIGAALVSAILLSTWSAFEISVMMDAALISGISRPGTTFFMQAMPYHFYTYIGIFLTFLVCWKGNWFGYRLVSQEENSLTIQEKESKGNDARLYHVVLPIASFLAFSLLGLLTFSYYESKSQESFELVKILGAVPTVEILLTSAFLSLLLETILLIKDRVFPKRSYFFLAVKTGILRMLEVAMVIVFSKGLALVCEKLQTGAYLTNMLGNFLHPAWLPALVFLTAAIITIATGFSWSTMPILMPVAYQFALASGKEEFLVVVSGAVISGSIAGSHLVPYSDTSLMASVSCGIKPLYHVKTQLLQVLCVLSASFIAYLLVGYGKTLIAYPVAIAIVFFIHLSFARSGKPK